MTKSAKGRKAAAFSAVLATPTEKMPPFLASVLGIVILEVLKKIPYVGILIKLAAVLYTMGYFIQYIYMGRTKKQKRENVVETAETLPELIEEHK